MRTHSTNRTWSKAEQPVKQVETIINEVEVQLQPTARAKAMWVAIGMGVTEVVHQIANYLQ